MIDRSVPSPLDPQLIQVDCLTVRVSNSAQALTGDALERAEIYLQTLLSQQETVRIILATGNSQLKFLEQITANAKLDWSRIVLFHLDEYLGIGAENPGSFRHYLSHRVEQQVKPRSFHYIVGDAPEPIAECGRYGKLLQQQPVDLCLLGIGDNGHLAFNEPGQADANDTQVIKLVQLSMKTRQQQVDGGYFDELATVPTYAYTLTIPTICNAKKIFCLAGGSHKAKVVQQTLKQDISPTFPATILRRQSQATLFCDLDAASLFLADFGS